MIFIGLLITLGIAFYFDNSTATMTNEFRSSILYTPEEIEAVSMEEVEETQQVIEQTEINMPTLEYLFEQQEEVDGYVVETYREYEIYYDKKGNQIKKVPTSHFDFIRYKK